MAVTRSRHKQKMLQAALASANVRPVNWLRPTFEVTRGIALIYNHRVQLPPIKIAVLDATPETATYEVLGCPASPVTVSREALAAMLLERGTKL